MNTENYAVPLPPKSKRLARLRIGAFVVVPLAAAIIGAITVSSARSKSDAAPPMAPGVTVAAPMLRDVIEWDDYVGRFMASEAVEVRPRVHGQIVGRPFKDGDTVKKGQVLFSIDQRPYLAAQQEARANVTGAQSASDLAKLDLSRATRLTGDDAVSGGEVDQLRARVLSAEASLLAARARLQSRSLDLEFTQIRAPISGVASDRRVDVGNLVTGGDGAAGTLLTTIRAMDPIFFGFDASEALFLKAQRDRKKGQGPSTVEIRLHDESGYRWKGKLDFTDNTLDPRSGTIRARAILANPDAFLVPGMVGNMRLAAASSVQALLIPDTAIQTDQARKIVLTVSADGTVSAKPVSLGPVVDGLRVISAGLTATDRVVIEGQIVAGIGSKVTVTEGRIAGDTKKTSDPLNAPVAAQVTFAR